MKVLRLDDPGEFLDRAGPWLRADEGRNQLALGIAASAVARRHGSSPFHGWVVVDDGVVAVAARTPPRNVILADPANDLALTVLAGAIAGDVPDAPGVVGNVPAVDVFADRWSQTTGDSISNVARQGVFELLRVIRPDSPRGGAEPARPKDLETLVQWWLAFETEALPKVAPDDESNDDVAEDARRGIEERLAGSNAGVWIWRIGDEPVSASGYAGPTGSGIRIGPVYTPPEHRRRGYATALVAELSAFLLANGFERCFLYTDLANPTANHIYETIGYARIAESRMLAFER